MIGGIARTGQDAGRAVQLRREPRLRPMSRSLSRIPPSEGSTDAADSVISLVVNCGTRAEVDEYRQRLSAGGESQVCGWLQDRYGVSWQVVPRSLTRMLMDSDARRTARVMQAIMTMTKIEIGELGRAFDGP